MLTAVDSLVRNDSLRRAVEQMFVEGATFVPAQPDSLRLADTLQAAAPPATAADLFGVGSSLAAQTFTHPTAPLLTNNPLFQGLVLLLMAAYVLLVYHHASDIYALVTRPESGRPGEARSTNTHSHFMNLAGMVGLLLAGLAGVKCIDLLIPAATLPYQAAAGASLIVTAALLAIVLIQTGMLLAIGLITLSQDFIAELNFIRRTTLAFMTVAIAPALLFYVLAPGDSGRIWAYIIGAEVVLILLFFLRRTLLLFISKKISILHWFLYLCTVEIFPISLLWLLITRE